MKLLQQRVIERASELKATCNAALENKFRKLPYPMSSRNYILVHNLSSKELTKEKVQVLRQEASFNTADANFVNVIAPVESVINQTEAKKETNKLIRHQVSPQWLINHANCSLRSNDRTVKSVELLLRSKYDETENHLGQVKVLQLLKFSLRTNFTFDRTIYDQAKRTPMGSPISGLIAQMVLRRLESLVFQHHRLNFRALFVDDTFVVIERNQVLTSKERLNSVFLDIHFTMEEEENN
ncbi:unnamed protein product [Schistocephalus solidus]|uniref:Reverse transcriptase domain-containing protein n=1 Tax=Schistocephalus solidus TaxID=70667 RepID=A0A183SKL1_SCHSO|nr:unnamed protein product [Schistocephalus solidus]